MNAYTKYVGMTFESAGESRPVEIYCSTRDDHRYTVLNGGWSFTLVQDSDGTLYGISEVAGVKINKIRIVLSEMPELTPWAALDVIRAALNSTIPEEKVVK